jgi:hypothetical protein
MANVIYDYEIPDLDEPIPDDAPFGPSGRLRPFVPPRDEGAARNPGGVSCRAVFFVPAKFVYVDITKLET